jgi:hypothetical protein
MSRFNCEDGDDGGDDDDDDDDEDDELMMMLQLQLLIILMSPKDESLHVLATPMLCKKWGSTARLGTLRQLRQTWLKRVHIFHAGAWGTFVAIANKT